MKNQTDDKWFRKNWKQHKTEITIFSTALISILYATLHMLWGKDQLLFGIYTKSKSTHDIIELTSLFIPVAAAIITFIAGGIDMSIWFSDNARKALEKKVEETEIAAKIATAERDAEWIEWAQNGKDPDKMPSKINPIQTEKPKPKTQFLSRFFPK